MHNHNHNHNHPPKCWAAACTSSMGTPPLKSSAGVPPLNVSSPREPSPLATTTVQQMSSTWGQGFCWDSCLHTTCAHAHTQARRMSRDA